MSDLERINGSSTDLDMTDTDELSSADQGDDYPLNHPNIPITVVTSTSPADNILPDDEINHYGKGIVNHAFEPEEFEHKVLNTEDEYLKDSLKPSLEEKIVNKEPNNIDTSMAINLKTGAAQTLDIPESESWMETDRSVFVTQRIQDLVQAFHARAEKIKEKLAQPPTPSPSPPLEVSSENERSPSSDVRGRLRLQSLIHQEDMPSPNVHQLNESVNLGCCSVQRKFVPTFPKVIDPQSKLYISWLFFVMLSYVYNAWVIVLRAVFHYQTADNLPIFLVFDYIADVIYVIDIALFKVRLQFLHDGFWVDDPEKTRQNYFKKVMFKMDVLSLLPLDLLYFVYGVRPIFRITRMLKTQTFWEFFHRVDAVAKTPYVIRIIRTLLYMMYLIHLNACAYYAMSEWEGIGTNGWVFQGEGNAYIRCFYFATKTATSIGKNPKPENEYEYVFMTISWLMGVFIFAFLIGQIRDIVATATQSKTQYRQLMDQTVMYMRNLNLPDDLQRRVRLWLNHTWEQQKTLNEGSILDSLPRKMKTDVAINVHYNTLVKVQLFKDCDKALLRDLVLQLKPVLFLPGDFVCRKGEVGKEMYIVNKGLVQVIGGESSTIVLATLSEGSVFGEISLLGIPGCSRRTADVKSQGFSNLFVLGKDDLWEALKNYPEAQKVLKKKAKSLIKENEARDRANKNNNITKVQPETIIKHGSRRSSTPRLMKTVMQIVPKDSKCAQLLAKSPAGNRRTSTNDSKPPSLEDENKILAHTEVNNSQPSPVSNETKHELSKILSPPPHKRPCPDAVKPRSMSDVTLRSSKYNPVSVSNVELRPKTPQPSSTVALVGSSSIITKQEEEQEEKTKSGDIITTILNMLPSELYARRKNIVHPVRSGSEPQAKMNTNSEDSGISVDNSMKRSSNQKLEDESFSICGSGDSSEISTTSTKRMATMITSPKLKDLSPQWSSVFSLRALFRTSSSQSCFSTQSGTDSPVSKSSLADEEETRNKRLESLTSAGSSTGYDNLAFVPPDVLSRRSSVFSDTSC